MSKDSFLNGYLNQEAYMQPPLRLHHPPNKFCHLCQALYGRLKQALRVWFAKFRTIVLRLAIPSTNLTPSHKLGSHSSPIVCR
jgi:hypothetical protein